MANPSRILIVEDEWLIAEDHAAQLREAGYAVVGPAGSVNAAIALVDAELVDAAILDIGLGKETSFPVAERLLADGVPFAFTTGYSAGQVPQHLKHTPLLNKPLTHGTLARIVMRMLGRE
jgi:DNA-binding response OmpR family regulator